MIQQQSRVSTFVSELRRRRVFRVAAFYGGIAFVIVQIIDGTFEVMGIPAWVSRLMITLLALGFPVAMALAWVFDITPEGIVRTDRASIDSERKGKVLPSSGKPLTSNRALIVVAVVAVAFGVWSRWGDDGTTGLIRSIAVLPLVNLMNDPDQDYFVDGMHEALTAELSRISALRVIGRTSTMSYKANPKPISEIAAELNVDAVIEGSVLRDGDRVRITVQLVATRPERHLWSDSYDRDLRDILELHSDVARAIAQEIKVALTPEEEARLAKSKAVHPEAYQAYLLGMYHGHQFDLPGIEKGIEYLMEATIIDPDYGDAFSGLAWHYIVLGLGHGNSGKRPLDMYRKAKQAAERGLELNQNSAFSQRVMAFIRYVFEFDWAGAEALYQMALELNPSPLAGTYGLFLSALGRHAEAVEVVERSLKHNPLSPISHIDAAIIYLRNQDFSSAERAYRRALELDDKFPPAQIFEVDMFTARGDFQGALNSIEDKNELVDSSTHAYLLGRTGRTAQAGEILAEFLERRDTEYVSAMDIARIYSGLEDWDNAVTWLSTAIDERAYWIAGLPADITFSDMHGTQRFKDLLRKMNFPE